MGSVMKPKVKADVAAERLREVLNYDAQTGIFTWRVSPSNRAPVGMIAGAFNRRFGYFHISIDGRLYRSCRLAWLHVYGQWPETNIDHINGVRTDDRIENLRDVSQSLNMQNIRAARVDNQSGFLGVSKHQGSRSKPWSARIHLARKVHHLGYFATGEEAHEAYLAAKRKLHEGCTI